MTDPLPPGWRGDLLRALDSHIGLHPRRMQSCVICSVILATYQTWRENVDGSDPVLNVVTWDQLRIGSTKHDGSVIRPAPQESTGWEPPTDPESDPVRRTPLDGDGPDTPLDGDGPDTPLD